MGRIVLASMALEQWASWENADPCQESLWEDS
jgi:hypothetical protein